MLSLRRETDLTLDDRHITCSGVSYLRISIGVEICNQLTELYMLGEHSRQYLTPDLTSLC